LAVEVRGVVREAVPVEKAEEARGTEESAEEESAAEESAAQKEGVVEKVVEEKVVVWEGAGEAEESAAETEAD